MLSSRKNKAGCKPRVIAPGKHKLIWGLRVDLPTCLLPQAVLYHSVGARSAGYGHFQRSFLGFTTPGFYAETRAAGSVSSSLEN